MRHNKWTQQEDETLLRLKRKNVSYLDIAEIIGGKTTDALRNRFYILTHKDKSFEDFEKEAKVLVYDIETSLMSFTGFRAGRVHYIGKHQLEQDYYIISWAAKWLGQDKIYSAVQTSTEARRCSDERILKPIWKLLDEADVVVGHNVANFDNRRLNTRFVKYDMGLPRRYKSVDTLKIARSTFDFTYNDLDFVCEYLGLPVRKKENEGYDMWLRCRLGEKDALSKMLEYNIGDVHAVEGLYDFLKSGLYKPPAPFRGGWKGDRQ